MNAKSIKAEIAKYKALAVRSDRRMASYYRSVVDSLEAQLLSA